MNETQKYKIRRMRSDGLSFGQIAKKMNLTRDAVSSFCRRDRIAENKNGKRKTESFCPNCGKEIIQMPKQKRRRFCSDKCCQDWWNKHLDEVQRRPTAIYYFTCKYCGKPFTAYGDSHRIYCSHDCYIKDRFGK